MSPHGKTLLLLRHAKSSWADEAVSDHDRPLNVRGKKAAPRMGKLLRKLELVPDEIVTSTANRALATAHLAAEAAAFRGTIIPDPSLYLASPDRYIIVASHARDEVAKLLLVGHNPGIERLVEQLTARPLAMPTAALAVIDLPLTSWAELTIDTPCTLRHVYRPRELT